MRRTSGRPRVRAGGVIETLQGDPWRVIVEPEPENTKLVVVTAYKVVKL